MFYLCYISVTPGYHVSLHPLLFDLDLGAQMWITDLLSANLTSHRHVVKTACLDFDWLEVYINLWSISFEQA